MTGKERFFSIIRGEKSDKTPIWFMRQAGRCLPEYRKLRESYSFKQLIKNPELATIATLQPIQRFKFDAAILFSDILVIPEALGQTFEFDDAKGLQFSHKIDNKAAVESLSCEHFLEKLQYVSLALKMIKRELSNKTALIGFSGSPFTLANYMISGHPIKNADVLFAFEKEQPALFEQLMNILTTAVSQYVQLQVDSGAEIIQIFDSWGHLCAKEDYERLSLKWIRQIFSKISAPSIIFSLMKDENCSLLLSSGAKIISVGASVDMKNFLKKSDSPTLILQGNLDPTLLSEETPDSAVKKTKRILSEMGNSNRLIFNLGHGVPPNAKLENIEAIINTVRN